MEKLMLPLDKRLPLKPSNPSRPKSPSATLLTEAVPNSPTPTLGARGTLFT